MNITYFSGPDIHEFTTENGKRYVSINGGSKKFVRTEGPCPLHFEPKLDTKMLRCTKC